jgi:Ca2+-binding RTX toxin-like protein
VSGRARNPPAGDAGRARGGWRARRFGAALLCVVGIGLIFAASLEALRPLCGGRQATIASDEPTIQGTPGPDVIVAGRGANAIAGGPGNDLICGGYGRDEIYGGRGNDILDGKKDRDVVHGGRGSDEVDGGAHRDRVFGDSGNDAVRGGAGHRDVADGGPGDDQAEGGRGHSDAVLGGIGRDRIDGGPGRHDIASYRSAGGPVEVDLAQGVVAGAEAERLTGIEDVVGGLADDVLTGSGASPNRLEGGAGDDRLLGGMPGDQAFGGPGSDQCLGPFAVSNSCGSAPVAVGTRVELYGGLGQAASLAIVGDDAADAISVGHRGRRYIIRSAVGLLRLGPFPPGAPCRYGGPLVSCPGPVDSIVASLGAGEDALTLSSAVPAGTAVTVDGGPGADRLRGGPGADTLYGGDDVDADRLSGGGGNDALFGINILHPRRHSGAATLLGGAGEDLLVGGQPCDGDRLRGGGGANDSASFARVRNAGIAVEATIGGRVLDPDAGPCAGGWIHGSVEKIEGSPGRDVLAGGVGPETLLGRGGADVLDGRGGPDRCIGGRGRDRWRHCEYVR